MQKIAVLSDIHSNSIALQTCLAYIEKMGIDAFIFLGDYIGELAYPQKTMDILYSLKERYPCFFVRGNKEDYMIQYDNTKTGWEEYDSTTGCLYDTYHHLRQTDLQFLKSLPIKEELMFGSLPAITICHGSPRKTNEKLLPEDENTCSIMKNNSNDLILCGHTHMQGKIEYHGKILLNPGAVGVSFHSKGLAQFMILKGEAEVWEHEFVSLDYDAEAAIAELHASGLSEKAPSWCKVTEHLLRTGEISHGAVLAKAMAICREQYGECNWPNIPEACWEQAVYEMGIS